ncbi:MAG: gamma-glutamyl-gamma-aminobutyrate hydrolase family protein [Deltaproteobacteria bacterium]|nr:gamma-glutamyl-gamma-aminobutyrate hydrolase family protein [Deltaproteobacteria bacterium]
MPILPLIGVSASHGASRDWSASAPTLLQTRLNYGYAEAIHAAGGLPLVLPTPQNAFAAPATDEAAESGAPSGSGRVRGAIAVSPAIRELCGRVMERLDGLILSGGGDVAMDGRAPLGLEERLLKLDRARDSFEAGLLRAALEAQKPVLGICRGLQLLNAALGGALWGDIQSDVQGAIEHRQRQGRSFASHPVTLREDSLLAGLCGTIELDVNSGHHQAVRTLGEGLVAAGWSPDGLVEAAEFPGSPFCVGVQWHPEGLFQKDPRAMALFKGLVARAAGQGGS